jgi:hypothetical protein
MNTDKNSRLQIIFYLGHRWIQCGGAAAKKITPSLPSPLEGRARVGGMLFVKIFS